MPRPTSPGADETFAQRDTLTAPVLDYLERLRVARDYSPNTLGSYRRDLARLIGFARALPITQWQALTPEHLQRFIAGEHRRGLTPTSVQRLLSSCRGLFLDLVREGILRATPAAGLRAPRAARKLPEVLDVDEMARLLSFEVLGPEDVRDMSDSGGGAARHDFIVAVLAGTDEGAGFRAVKEAAVAVSAALEGADLVTEVGHVAGLWFLRARAKRVENGAERRVDLTFRALMDLV